jgi:probable F420-dependent oxidoreductase
MDFGIALPNFRAGASAEGIEAAAEAAERLGWSDVWTTDHVIVEHGSEREYGRIFEAILTLAWAGARHPGVGLGTSVIVVPPRNAVILAKELATLDVLSGGRVICGVGVGWNAREFANMGMADRFHVRGAYLDEAIRLWRHLWSGSQEPFEGRFTQLSDFVFEPLPAQGGRLPIWVGGGSDAALRRAGALGDGYHASAVTPDRFAARVPKVLAAATDAGRAAPSLSAPVQVRMDRRISQGYAMQGSADDIAAEVRSFAAAGASHLVLNFGVRDPEPIVAAAESFAREVIPLL